MKTHVLAYEGKGVRDEAYSYFSDLPVFRDSVPNSNLPSVTGGYQLVTHKEQSLYWDVEAKDTCRMDLELEQIGHRGKIA